MPSVSAMTRTQASADRSRQADRAGCWKSKLVPSRAVVGDERLSSTSDTGDGVELVPQSSLRACSIMPSARSARCERWRSRSVSSSTISTSGSRSSLTICGRGQRQQGQGNEQSARQTDTASPAPGAEAQDRPAPARARRSNHRATADRARTRPRAGRSLAEPLQQGRHMHLIGLVVAGERIHHDD